MPESKDKCLEKLSEELIQVFNFDNIHRSTTSQKEALVQKIIKLGGEDYTAEDLRRDILRIEKEDNLLKQDKQIGNKADISQETDITIMGDLKVAEQKDMDLNDLRDKICSELEDGEFEKIEDYNSPTEQNLEIYHQEFGILMNQEGLSSPIYGKLKRKRGRKSLKELRESEGLAREQKKIDELLKMGKGKCLPKAP